MGSTWAVLEAASISEDGLVCGATTWVDLCARAEEMWACGNVKHVHCNFISVVEGRNVDEKHRRSWRFQTNAGAMR